MEAFLDQFKNRNRFIFGVIDKSLPHQRRNDDRGHSNSCSPAIGTDWRRYVIPASTVFIIGNNNRAVLPRAALFHGIDQVSDMLLAGYFRGVTRMFVIDSSGLYKRNRG